MVHLTYNCPCTAVTCSDTNPVVHNAEVAPSLSTICTRSAVRSVSLRPHSYAHCACERHTSHPAPRPVAQPRHAIADVLPDRSSLALSTGELSAVSCVAQPPWCALSYDSFAGRAQCELVRVWGTMQTLRGAKEHRHRQEGTVSQPVQIPRATMAAASTLWRHVQRCTAMGVSERARRRRVSQAVRLASDSCADTVSGSRVWTHHEWSGFHGKHWDAPSGLPSRSLGPRAIARPYGLVHATCHRALLDLSRVLVPCLEDLHPAFTQVRGPDAATMHARRGDVIDRDTLRYAAERDVEAEPLRLRRRS